jgi:sulfur-oxidizing protein SoxY
MQDTVRLSLIPRRAFLVSTAAAALLHSRGAWADASDVTNLERSQLFQNDFARLTKGAKPVEGQMTVDLPDIAENGNFVPITIAVESPMTDADHVKAIHVLSTANPFAHIATFHLSPLNGIARVQGRIRLAKTQDVVTLADLSTGKTWITTTLVKVTIGGCG